MHSALIFVALTLATANAGLIGAPWGAPIATSLAGPALTPIGLGAPLLSKSVIAGPALAGPIGLGLGAPLLGKSIIAGPALTSPVGLGLGAPLLGKSIIAGPVGLGLGAPLLGKSVIAGPAISPLGFAAGPVLKAW